MVTICREGKPWKPPSQPILKSLRIAVYDQPVLSRINGRYVFLNKSTH